MWLVRLALRRPITIVVLAFAIVLAAWLAIWRAPVNIFPSLGVPVIYVVQPYGGMTPSQMGELLHHVLRISAASATTPRSFR
jgi:multidrug efflux pump subunit AcrB